MRLRSYRRQPIITPVVGCDKTEEFGETDYSELFYSAKQEQKSLSEFYYHLSELASKSNISRDATFITQFLKGLKPFFNSKLANSHLPNKQALKGVINQIEKLKIYLRANKLEDEDDKRKVAILLQFIGPEALTIFYSFDVDIDVVTYKEKRMVGRLLDGAPPSSACTDNGWINGPTFLEWLQKCCWLWTTTSHINILHSFIDSNPVESVQGFSFNPKVHFFQIKFIKQVCNIATESLGNTASQRLDMAQSLANNEQLFKNFNFLINMRSLSKMARRYTLDEKLRALILMKQSPKNYKVLQAMLKNFLLNPENIFFDPPHLLKGLRNIFLTKNIIWQGKTATWKDIEFVFDLDSKLGHTRALPKLTAHHVDAKKIKKMKVSVATQVQSARTAAMLKYTNALNSFHTGHTESTMENTAEVVEFFDKLFDSVNGYPGGAVRGKLRKAVKKNSEHVTFWGEAIKKIKSLKFIDSDSKLAMQNGKPRFVTVPSLASWITTLESFIRISKLLFDKYGVESKKLVLSHPLENFFGRVRAINYRNVNPDANSFIYSFKSLFANCEVDSGEMLLDANFLFETDNNEKQAPNVNVHPSSSREDLDSSSGRISIEEVALEKVKVQCSAYTAGYICRKLSKSLNCNLCQETYISIVVDDIHTYIHHREYKSLKNNNLVYPSERFLILYRNCSQFVHDHLNQYCHMRLITKHLKISMMSNMSVSWLGCAIHSNCLIELFIKYIVRLHTHNWCNIINKILKGDIPEKYVTKMREPQRLAMLKYKTFRLRINIYIIKLKSDLAWSTAATFGTARRNTNLLHWTQWNAEPRE
ncbi:hypothetical protein ABMA28_003508 [Loxostege sticticalis]|uniref:Transposable element P transposase-like GTP-binding insertion domain-containing protein n=1 Tax=Loxostege sticticalis TaxID=481309 RepID=A0ABD0T0N6_LOXSC